MTRDDIIAMAREAGLIYWTHNRWWTDAGEFGEEIERFAALIASRAASEEREACAKVLDEMAEDMEREMEPSTAIAYVRSKATAIRSRSSEHCARRDVVTYGKTTSKERSMGTVSGLDIANKIEQEWQNKCEAYMKLMDAHAKELDRAMELLSRAENEMRYAGWTRFESDNPARNGVYEDIKEFLK